jgi:hypothetical protein
MQSLSLRRWEINEQPSGVWFSHVHLEKLPSAISRYRKEVRRVLGVLNTALEGKKYLVGDKITIADLAFVPWHSVIPVCPPHFSQHIPLIWFEFGLYRSWKFTDTTKCSLFVWKTQNGWLKGFQMSTDGWENWWSGSQWRLYLWRRRFYYQSRCESAISRWLLMCVLILGTKGLSRSRAL